MKYTFLMPAFKAAYIEESINSIINQSFIDFRLIISDDCSPENIKTIVDKFHDNRISFRHNEVNIGGKDLVAHWNLLLNLSQSDYVILAPDDDIYFPTFLEEIDKLTKKYPEVDVLKCRVQKIDENGDLIQMDRVYEEKISQLDNLFHQALPDHMSGIGNYVFKTKKLKEIGGFINYPLAWWSDVMTNVKLSSNGMAITKDILFTMRLSGINITSRKGSLSELRRKAEATMKCYDDVEELISSYEPLSKYESGRMKIVRQYWKQWLTDDLIQSANAFSFKEAKRISNKYSTALASKINRIIFWKRVLIP